MQREALCALEVHALRVEYEDRVAVNDVSFTLEPGSICALIGPNGAGKTSMMRALVGLLEPTWGSVKIGPYPLSTRRVEASLQIGFMPADPPLYHDLSAYEFLELFAASYQLPRAGRQAKIESLLAEVGLSEKRDALAGTLSSGMRQRLFLARTLIHDPPVLILDEPASGLDPLARAELGALLKRLAAQGKVVLISSHILTELDSFCSHALILEQGRCLAFDSLAGLRTLEAHAARASLRLAPSASDAEWARAREIIRAHRGEGEGALPLDESGTLSCPIADDEDAAALLRALLVEGELPVCHFALQERDLQALFFSVSRGETQ